MQGAITNSDGRINKQHWDIGRLKNNTRLSWNILEPPTAVLTTVPA